MLYTYWTPLSLRIVGIRKVWRHHLDLPLWKQPQELPLPVSSSEKILFTDGPRSRREGTPPGYANVPRRILLDQHCCTHSTLIGYQIGGEGKRTTIECRNHISCRVPARSAHSCCNDLRCIDKSQLTIDDWALWQFYRRMQNCWSCSAGKYGIVPGWMDNSDCLNIIRPLRIMLDIIQQSDGRRWHRWRRSTRQ